MARFTQFIGLNSAANSFLEDKLESESEEYTVSDMFDEIIRLSIWEDESFVYREKLQACPWSSGPMIFTCLESESKISGIKEVHFLWIEDIKARGIEVIYEENLFYV